MTLFGKFRNRKQREIEEVKQSILADNVQDWKNPKSIPTHRYKKRFTVKQWKKFSDDKKQYLTNRYTVILIDHKAKLHEITKLEKLKAIPKKITQENFDKGMQKFDKGMDTFNKAVQAFSSSTAQVDKDLKSIKSKDSKNLDAIWGKKKNKSAVTIWGKKPRKKKEKSVNESIWGKKEKPKKKNKKKSKSSGLKVWADRKVRL